MIQDLEGAPFRFRSSVFVSNTLLNQVLCPSPPQAFCGRFPQRHLITLKTGNRGGQRLALLLRPALACRRIMAGFHLRKGNLLIHTANPVFAALPLTTVALQDLALEFALQKLGRHVRDERPLQ
jgi:hypothetical protein